MLNENFDPYDEICKLQINLAESQKRIATLEQQSGLLFQNQKQFIEGFNKSAKRIDELEKRILIMEKQNETT